MTQTIPWFVQHVTAQLGVPETPLGSNHQPYGRKFGWDGVSWCDIFGWCMYTDAGVILPVKSAACVVSYDAAKAKGLVYNSAEAVAGDSIIRTWQRLPRNRLNPAETHYQIVVGTHTVNGRKILDLIGGNQGPGIVSRDTVSAGDATILGALAFHTLFTGRQAAQKTSSNDAPRLPKGKSHPKSATLLSLGSHGALVIQVQTALQHLGYYRGYRIDGDFGGHTLGAVTAFQKHTWPKTPRQWDGQVGPFTFKALGLGEEATNG